MNILTDVLWLHGGRLILGSYCIGGGAMLAERGVRLNHHDVDLLVLPDYMKDLMKYWHEVTLGSNGMDKTDRVLGAQMVIDTIEINACPVAIGDERLAKYYIKSSELIDGLPFMRIIDCLDLKMRVIDKWPDHLKALQHINDIDLMRKHVIDGMMKKA